MFLVHGNLQLLKKNLLNLVIVLCQDMCLRLQFLATSNILSCARRNVRNSKCATTVVGTHACSMRFHKPPCRLSVLQNTFQ